MVLVKRYRRTIHVTYDGPIISWSAAKADGRVRYFNGKACRAGHVVERLVSSRQCTKCLYLKALERKRSKVKNLQDKLKSEYGSRLVSRQEAKNAGLSHYFTGKPCRRGHIDNRTTIDATCVTCELIARKKGGSKYPSRMAAMKRRRKFSNSDAAVNYRLGRDLRARLSLAVRNDQRAGSAVRDLGCSLTEFRAYIADKFKPGMTWNNRGIDTWHLDHIVPLAAFNLKDRRQFLKACHYTNYQPLWAAENLEKGARYAA